MLYLHGIQSHGGWYEGSGAFLAESGFAVLMPDRRGSGLNTAARGHADSVLRLLRDGMELLRELRTRSGCTDVDLVGVSWGGKIAVALASTLRRGIRSLSLVAPGLFPTLDLPMAEKFRIAWAMLSEPKRPFPLPLNEPRLFTKNPEKLAFLEQDHFRLLEVSASFLIASRRLDRYVQRFVDSTWRGPLHVMLAGDDRIIDNERTREFVRRLLLADRRITEYPGASHTLEFEPDPRPFWNDLLDGIVGNKR